MATRQGVIVVPESIARGVGWRESAWCAGAVLVEEAASPLRADQLVAALLSSTAEHLPARARSHALSKSVLANSFPSGGGPQMLLHRAGIIV